MAIQPTKFVKEPIKFVKSLYYANRPFVAKAEKTMVDIPYSFEDNIYNKIASQYNRMEYVSAVYNIPFKFAQKGDIVLANFGTKTSVFSTSAKAEEVQAVIDELIHTATSYVK